MHTFSDVEDVYYEYISSEEDRKRISEAYEFMLKKHEGQKRMSGEPYAQHLIEVAYILSDLHCGPNTIIAGLLHDTLEDTQTSLEEIVHYFGEDVGMLVESLTKIQRLKLSRMENEEFEAEDHRRIFIGMAKDIRVILIKLADRLHNLRTLGSLAPDRQLALAHESMDVFIPIAHRLGLDKIKSEMQDLCLKYLEPDIYKHITSLLTKKTKTMEKSLDGIKKRIADILFENHIPFEIESRVKSIYSIYHKMYILNTPFDEIYDILALRIITDTEIQCYEILGLIHQTYVPIPGRFKDYIAMPKPNLYQSLHTSILGGDGNRYEIQIRTKEMDEVAEVGVAAHWAYKEGNGYNSKQEQQEIENKLHWFRDFVSLSSNAEEGDAKEYVDSLTKDIFEANIYVFTPKGKVIELPTGSTPVDFAYKIHTKVGDTTVGALVNGVMVPLNTILETGDMVEIKTSKNSTPSEGWLSFVKSSLAKQSIKRYISKKNADQERKEKIQKGKQSLLDSFKDKGIDEEEMVSLLNTKKVLEHFECNSLDDLYVMVYGRKPAPSAVIDYLKIRKPVNTSNNSDATYNFKADSTCPVYCKGADNIAISLANCCTPIPGDEIVGFITRGKGISVHRHDCPNIENEPDRLIDVYWKPSLDKEVYPVDLVIQAVDRQKLLLDITSALANHKIPLTQIHGKVVGNSGKVNFQTTILVPNSKRLTDVINILLNINGVYDIKRAIH